MFRTLQNLVTLRCTLRPDGPLLIRAQSVGIDPGLADMEFQRTHRNGRNTVFLAGSGLKGVLRSHCERLLRSSDRFACDPTSRDASSCGATRREQDPPPDPRRYPHGSQCPACFTFGSLKLAGRFRVADAYPIEGAEEEAANRTEVRTGVGIDRKSQAARNSVLYDAEVVVGGAFEVRISGENFSLWQLGLVLASMQDLDQGMVRIGGAKARGMGSVRLEGWSVDLSFLDAKDGTLAGTRPLDQEDHGYGLPANDVLAAPHGYDESRRGLFRVVRFSDPAPASEERAALGDSTAESPVQRLAGVLIDGPLRTYLRAGGH